MRRRTQRIKFISIKLPASGELYPLDGFGCRKLPNYTTEYLRKRARLFHNILRNKVPGTFYSELLRLMKAEEAGHQA
jgi:hypothetical protein